MSGRPPGAHRDVMVAQRRWLRVGWTAALVCLLGALICSAIALGGRPEPRLVLRSDTDGSIPEVLSSAKPPSELVAPLGDLDPPESQVRPVPTRVQIPTLGVDSDLVTLGINADETVEVPTDPDQAGWYRLGAVPGTKGSAVILGHVDSTTGPAVFADLASLRPGDQVTVSLPDEKEVRFEVTSVRTFDRSSFPAQRIYGDHGGRRALNLITCGGSYDPQEGGYQSNVVVFSRRVPHSQPLPGLRESSRPQGETSDGDLTSHSKGA